MKIYELKEIGTHEGEICAEVNCGTKPTHYIKLLLFGKSYFILLCKKHADEIEQKMTTNTTDGTYYFEKQGDCMSEKKNVFLNKLCTLEKKNGFLLHGIVIEVVGDLGIVFQTEQLTSYIAWSDISNLVPKVD
jgi:hypothetical protein